MSIIVNTFVNIFYYCLILSLFFYKVSSLLERFMIIKDNHKPIFVYFVNKKYILIFIIIIKLLFNHLYSNYIYYKLSTPSRHPDIISLFFTLVKYFNNK